VALELTLRHPGRVSALVLTGSSGLFERSFTRGVPHRPTPEWVRAKMEEIFFDPACVTAEWVEAVHRAVTRRDSALRILQTARAAKRSSLGERLPRIAAPTCLIWGEEDQITPPEVARLFADRIPGSDLHLIPRCGHAPMLEQPEAFNCILGAWLERTDAARRARQVLAEAA
jgi:pimeloyl-ACP methyl ester carboxylesterase